jgi:hypothetical protein
MQGLAWFLMMEYFSRFLWNISCGLSKMYAGGSSFRLPYSPAMPSVFRGWYVYTCLWFPRRSCQCQRVDSPLRAGARHGTMWARDSLGKNIARKMVMWCQGCPLHFLPAALWQLESFGWQGTLQKAIPPWFVAGFCSARHEGNSLF